MLSADPAADDRPALYFLHFLGGSARSWDDLVRRLAPVARCVPIDLPGFGAASGASGYTVAEMAARVADIVRAGAGAPWLLVGHSMGCKVAALLARQAEDGAAGLEGLRGLVLVSGSPPCPEPMSDERRETMLGWFAGSDEESRAEAEQFIGSAVSRKLGDDARERAVGDVLRTSPDAWRAWLEAGSLEDVSGHVGVLRTPALIVAGADDADLGPEAQHALMAPHFADARIVVMPDTGHLLPLEWPDRLARLIEDRLAAPPGAASVAPSYLAFIASERVSSRTRALLLGHAEPDEPAYRPLAVTSGQLVTLRAVLSRVLPQTSPFIDLAARIDSNLAGGIGDGWRFDALPPDTEAYRAALGTLDVLAGGSFVSRDDAARDELLKRIADGSAEAAGAGLLTGSQLKLWFEDLLSDAVRLYVAHPATLARIGYSGIGYGGDGEPKAGFRTVGIGEREAWEPQAQTVAP